MTTSECAVMGTRATAPVAETLPGSFVSAPVGAPLVRVSKADDGDDVDAVEDAGLVSAPTGVVAGAKRRLRNLRVTFVSLVERGANGRRVIAKADVEGADGAGGGADAVLVDTPVRIVKRDDVRRVVYGVVYAPDCVDSEGDTMTAAEIEKAAYGFLREARTGAVDRQHDEVPVAGAYVAESWLVRAGDALFPGEVEGAWAVGIKVDDAATWADVEAGRIGGLSLMGEAQVEDMVATGSETTDPSTGSGQADGRQTTNKADALEGAEQAMKTGRQDEATTVLDRVRKALGFDGASGVHEETMGPDDAGGSETRPYEGSGADDGAGDGAAGGGVAVAKDYASRRLAAQIQANTWTLGDALREALDGGGGTSTSLSAGAGEVLASIDQYRAEVAGLLGVDETDKAVPRKPKNVWRGGTSTPLSASDGEMVEKSALRQAQGPSADTSGDGGDVLTTLAKSVETLAARVEALAVATPGRQSAETREGDEGVGVAKGKGFRGVRFV